MTEPTTTTPAPAPAPVTAPVIAPPVVAPPDGTVADLQRQLAEATTRASTYAQQLASAASERDTFKTQVAELAPKAAQAAELQVKVEGFVNQARETALIDKLRADLPGADPLALRGTVIALAEAGKAHRYPTETGAEAAKILDLIKSEAPGLTRPLTAAGGSAGAPRTTLVHRPKHPLG